ncbi:hypothetical protein RWV98_07165 [Agathobaculum sp. NTUH-O15-33]|uniref:hypothetical protein n=1 Tax=Agathobaculum sp. NTUH-O15-33 TaxID=3079302 RepID=UPI002958CD86|nr:hypothetical protein [Agathobaculum sp. NTUH-O15-33]WNX86044.1 hypothetical protein RWV98_07165 [Agathobaculum sp. NTUH-O15-33]
MLIDETKYIWKRGGNMEISFAESPYAAYFTCPLKVYLIEGSAEVLIYTNEEMTELIFEGSLPFEPINPIACDALFFVLISENTLLHITAEVGTEKTVLLPFLNTAENMEYISNSYNDDSTYNTAGIDGFMFNGITSNPLYISSNHWVGFGISSEQLRILRRDGCSTAIYRQLGETTNGLQFLKIRFEGYTAYNNRVDATRLIFELFLLSNNDMFLNVIQTPTSTGYLGTSDMICGGTTTALTLADGSGRTQVSFYHQNDGGRTWNIVYAMYEETDTYSFAYLVRQADAFYTYADGALTEVAIETLSAAMFLKYGFEKIPPAEILTPIDNMQMYLWKAGGAEELLKANVKAYPYPQVLNAVADMSHISILGIKIMTAEYSGNVTVSISVDNGQTYSEDMTLGDLLNTDVEELYNSLSEEKRLMLRFTLHDNAAISRFKITYIN